MEVPKLNLSSLKDKIASNIAAQKKTDDANKGKNKKKNSEKKSEGNQQERPQGRSQDRSQGKPQDRYNNSRGGDDRNRSNFRNNDRPQRDNRYGDRPPRDNNRFGDRSARDNNNRFGDRPNNRYGDKPPRDNNRFNDRPPRDNKFGGDRPSRDNKFGDRAPRDNKYKERSSGDRQTSFKKNDYKKPETAEPKVEETEDERFRREALELGASEADLEYLKAIDVGEDSEQEFDGVTGKKVDSAFSKDLSEFMSGIGFDGTLPVVADDEVESEVEEDSDEEDAESESDEEEEIEDEVQEESEDEAEVEVEAEAESDSEEEPEQQEAVQQQESSSEAEEEEVAEPFKESISEPAKKKVEITEPEAKKEQKKSNKDKIKDLSNVVTDKLLIPARNDWYNIDLPKSQPSREILNPKQIEILYARGKEIVENENNVYYEEFNKSSSQKKFLSQVLTSGTLNDKVSALTLLIQEAPMHNIKSLNNLFGMCNKKSRTAALQCINAVFDLFVNGILPPDRKLKYFKKQPTLSQNSSDLELALFYFEDYLKDMYFQFIGILEKLSHDSIVYVRTKVVGYIFELLKAKPEQESNLLRLGVNKLGDIDNKVSSKTSYQILMLEQQHPAMKQIVVDAVVDILFRKNNEYHAIYYSILTLNQTILTKKEDTLANKLVNAYFAIFEKLLIKTDDQNKGELKTTKINQGRTKRNSKKGKKGGESVKDERTEEEIIEEKNHKLFAAILTGLNRSYPFSNLPKKLFEDHLDTLYKITHSTNFNTSIQALLLIHNIVITHNIEGSVRDRYYRTLYESLLDSRVLTSSKQGIYLNLLYKSLKNDSDLVRLFAFIKRITQICLSWLNIGTVSGMIYLLIELEKSNGKIRNLFTNTPMDDLLEKEDEDDEDEENDEANDSTKETKQDSDKAEIRQYDPRKRDPRFTNADKSSLWEINQFINHYHPTVALYANVLLNGSEDGVDEPVVKPDLGLFTLSHFLDRFVYKNSKKKVTTRGSSIMQPLGGSQTGSLLVKATGGLSDRGQLPANSEDWLHKKLEDIKPEDKFFYTYFISKQEKMNRSKIDKELEGKAKGEGSDDEDVEDIDEDDVWNALVKSNPEVEGDEEDYDDEMSDLDMEDFDAGDDNDESDEELDMAAINEGEDDDDSDVEVDGDDELVTLDDLVDEEAEEDDDEEIVDQDDDSDVESDNELQGLLAGDDSDEFDSEEIELKTLGDSESSDEEVEEVVATKGKKRKGETDSKANKKSKKSKLPLFASADDYAQYLGSSDEE